MVLFLLSLLLALGALGAPAAAQGTLTGAVRVIDGDTLAMGAVRLRLHGIDAPERDQSCTDARGRPWPCGIEASEALERLAGNGSLRCQPRGQDRFGRTLAVCHAAVGDLGAALVARGWALAFRRYATDYVSQEARARAGRLGLWRGGFDSPEAFRSAERAARQTSPDPVAPDPACAIKGNISAAGRLYHLPGSPAYARTRIRPGRGERWFCTAAQARAAGWRQAGQGGG